MCLDDDAGDNGEDVNVVENKDGTDDDVAAECVDVSNHVITPHSHQCEQNPSQTVVQPSHPSIELVTQDNAASMAITHEQDVQPRLEAQPHHDWATSMSRPFSFILVWVCTVTTAWMCCVVVVAEQASVVSRPNGAETVLETMDVCLDLDLDLDAQLADCT